MPETSVLEKVNPIGLLERFYVQRFNQEFLKFNSEIRRTEIVD